jgi:cell division protein FtsL
MNVKNVVKKEETWLSPLVWALFLIVVALLIAKIFISNQLATTGAVVNSHSSELERLKAENRQLANEVSVLGSIQQISKKAAKIGLKSSPRVEVLKGQSSVALNR